MTRKGMYVVRNRAGISGLVFMVSLVMGGVSVGILYLMDEDSLLYYGDATSHLYAARVLADSNEQGIAQIGTVWLPLPHIMMLPFSLEDSLFSSGLAGLVNLPLHALTAVLIYRIILTQTGRPWIGVVGGLLYASNPNLLYLGVTAMTEAPFLLFFVTSVYFMQKWTGHDPRLWHVLLASVLVSLATLCRYEAWILAPFLVMMTVFFACKRGINYTTAMPVLISLVSFSGILFWAVWNQVNYGDPLEFANAQFYAAASQAVERPNRDFLYLQPHNVIYIYGAASAAIMGPILASALSGGIIALRDRIRLVPHSIHLYMSLPVLFTLLAMLVGIGEMNQWWFNARFATFLYPLAIVLTAITLLKLERINRRTLLGCVVAGMFVFQVATLAFGVVTYLDAYWGWNYKQTPFARQTAGFLYENYDDGKILIMTGSAQAHKIMVFSGADLVDFNEGIEAHLSKTYFTEPWKHNKWLVLGLEPDSDAINAVKFWSENINEIGARYEMVYENQYYQVFKIKE